MNIDSYRRRGAVDRRVAMTDGPATTTTDNLGDNNQAVAYSREENASSMTQLDTLKTLWL